MARGKSNTADFFVHTKSGRTKMILVSKFGNDGSSFLFNLLEILTASDGHFFDCRIPGNMMYLASYCNLSEEKAREIISCMVEIGKLDRDLWENGVIWYQKFVDNFTELYKKRGRPLPQKPILVTEMPALPSFPVQECGSPVIFEEKSTIEEKRREEKSIGERTKPPALQEKQKSFPALSPGRDSLAAALADETEIISRLKEDPPPETLYLAAEVMERNRGQPIGADRKSWIEAVRTAHGNLKNESWYVNAGSHLWLLDVKAGKYNGEQARIRVEKYQKFSKQILQTENKNQKAAEEWLNDGKR